MVLIVAGVGKAMAQGNTYDSFIMPAFLSSGFTDVLLFTLPYFEIVLGLLLVVGLLPKVGAAISAGLILCFTLSNIYLLTQGIGYCNSCFGALGGMSVLAALTLDAIMAVLVATIFSCQQGKYINIIPWYLGRTVSQVSSARQPVEA